MKYKLLTIAVFILGVFVFRLSFIKDIVSDYEIVYEQVQTIEHKIYYYDETNLVYVNIDFDHDIKVEDVFDLLTNKSNSIIEDYDTKLIVSTKLIDYEINNNTIILNLSEDFLRYKEEECGEIYNQLKHSYSNIGYSSLVIKINNIHLEKIGFINIKDGIPLSNI